MALGQEADRFLLQRDRRALATLVAFAVVTAGELATERLLAAHHPHVFKTTVGALRADGVVPVGADPRRVAAQLTVLKARAVVAVVAPVAAVADRMARHRARHAAVDPPGLGAAADDLVAADDDTGDADREAEEMTVFHHRPAVRGHRFVEVTHRHKRVPVGRQPVIGLDLRAVGDVHGVEGFGRERRPADAFVIPAPRDPGRRPGVAGDPGPAMIDQQRPAAVVVRGPAERLVGHPGPALVGIHPASARVRPPAGLAGRARPPDPPVRVALQPFAMRAQTLVKHLVVAVVDGPGHARRRRRGRRRGGRWFGHRLRRRRGRGLSDRGRGRGGLLRAFEFQTFALQGGAFHVQRRLLLLEQAVGGFLFPVAQPGDFSLETRAFGLVLGGGGRRVGRGGGRRGRRPVTGNGEAGDGQQAERQRGFQGIGRWVWPPQTPKAPAYSP